jgi:hypothetical protein
MMANDFVWIIAPNPLQLGFCVNWLDRPTTDFPLIARSNRNIPSAGVAERRHSRKLNEKR